MIKINILFYLFDAHYKACQLITLDSKSDFDEHYFYEKFSFIKNYFENTQ